MAFSYPILYRQITLRKQGAGVLHPAAHQIFLGRNSHPFLEDGSQVTAVDANELCNISDGNVGVIRLKIFDSVIHIDRGIVFRCVFL